jgi:hypothetical protein
MDSEEKNYSSKLVCNKGNMLLREINMDSSNSNNEKAYNITFDFKKLDPKKINIKTMLTHNIFQIIQEVSPDLIEKVFILNELNPNETDICILMKPIAKELGIKSKYMMFRIRRGINFNANVITFYNKDLILVDPSKTIINEYIRQINLDINNYKPIILNYGKIIINLKNLLPLELMKLNNEENFTNLIDIDFSIDFIISIREQLPIYMENIIGLMIKKIFYNLKQFIDNLNN